MPESAEAFHRQYVADRLDRILVQVELTNGRVRKAEIAIAVLQWGYGLGAAVIAGWAFDVFSKR